MGGKKKAAAHNAYFYFMLDYRKREEARGRKFRNMEEVSAICGKLWPTMSSSEKQPYEKKADELKCKTKTTKFTSLEEPMSEVTKRNNEQIAKIRNMEKDIENMINSNLMNEAFADMVFYIGHVNYYCCVNNKYYPAEIGIIKFSLRHGVNGDDVFHSIFDIGELPIGYRLQAEKIAEETHQLTLPPHNNPVLSRKDIRECFNQMLMFLSDTNRTNEKYPPIFVLQKDSNVIENVIQNFLIDFDYDEDLLKIYSLEYLFYVLRNAAHMNLANEQVFISKAVALHELDKDIYDYVQGISCPYHSTSEAYPYCSLSKVVRAGYTICDHCCGDLNIHLLPGRHIPVNSEPYRLQERPISRVRTEMSTPSSSDRKNSIQSNHSDVSKNAPLTSGTTRRPLTASRLAHPEALTQSKAKVFEWETTPDEPSFDKNDFPALSNVRGISKKNNDFPTLRDVGNSLDEAWESRPDSSTHSGSRICVGRGRGRVLKK